MIFSSFIVIPSESCSLPECHYETMTHLLSSSKNIKNKDMDGLIKRTKKAMFGEKDGKKQWELIRSEYFS